MAALHARFEARSFALFARKLEASLWLLWLLRSFALAALKSKAPLCLLRLLWRLWSFALRALTAPELRLFRSFALAALLAPELRFVCSACSDCFEVSLCLLCLLWSSEFHPGCFEARSFALQRIEYALKLEASICLL